MYEVSSVLLTQTNLPNSQEHERPDNAYRLGGVPCKSHEHRLRAQSLADKLGAADSFNFWRGVRNINPGSHTIPLRVDHAVGEDGIASMGGDHFKGILNCVRDEESENALRGGMRGVSLQGFRSVDHEEMRGILQSLSSSEALGIGCHMHDGCINSLSYADDMRKFSYFSSREVKMELFRSHCYSIHCNSLWSRFNLATLNRLKVCHNDILKRLLGLPRWCSSSLAFARNEVNNLDVIRRHSVFSLRSRVELSANSTITSLRQSSAYVCGSIQQRWLGLLFVQNVG
ncbi:hypothetical protein GWK47_035364 [Chionoecetes opilio]|uniref:Uncharacterized protein n=1 Tax=Chionoecetes opilio TaxID=41210 RepID=A0A8J5D386_CHIOP|nr:hypothetical protein GWK47_035364 [Chionoecetes opilio]